MKNWLMIFALWGILAGVGRDATVTAPAVETVPETEVVEEVREEPEAPTILVDEVNKYDATIYPVDLPNMGSAGVKYGFVDGDLLYEIIVKENSSQKRNSYLRAYNIYTGKQEGDDIALISELKDCEVDRVVLLPRGDYVAYARSKDNALYVTDYLLRYSSDGQASLMHNIKSDWDGRDLSSEWITGFSAGESGGCLTSGAYYEAFGENLYTNLSIKSADDIYCCAGSDGVLYRFESYSQGKFATNTPEITAALSKMPVIEDIRGIFAGNPKEVLVTDGKSLYSYNVKDVTVTKLFNLLPLNIDAYEFKEIYRDTYGGITIVYTESKDAVVYYVARVTASSKTGATYSNVSDINSYSIEIEDYGYEENDGELLFSMTDSGLLYNVIQKSSRSTYHDFLRIRDALTGEKVHIDVDLSLASKTLVPTQIIPSGNGGYVVYGYEYLDGASEDVLERLSDKGELVKLKKLSDIKGLDGGDSIIMSLQSDGANTYVTYLPMSGDDAYISKTMVLDIDFNVVTTLDVNSTGVRIGSDNLVYVLDSGNGCLSVFNPKTKELKEGLASIDFCFGLYNGFEGELLITSFGSLYSYDICGQKLSRLFDYEDLGFDAPYVESIFRSEDGSVHFVYGDYSEGDYKAKIAHVVPKK